MMEEMLADKDIPAVINWLRPVISQWYVATLDTPRAAPITRLLEVLDKENTHIFDRVEGAYNAALSDAEPQDRIVVFGSFYTVAVVLSQAV